VVYGQVARLSHRAKYDRGKVGLLAIVVRPPDELNDFRAHENPSHIAIATKPTNASDIRYAVMLASLVRVRPQIQPTGLSDASVIARSDLSAVAQRAKAKAAKQSRFRAASGIASRSLSSGAAFAPIRWLAMPKSNVRRAG
jgi:hypothetical protein